MKIIKNFLKKGDTQAPCPPAAEEKAIRNVEKSGWVSPAYHKIRSAILDPAIIAQNRCIAVFPSAPEVEAYKMLRRKVLNATKANGWNTIMITSALPGEGKTLTAINLSMTFAREYDQTVLLVDCDLRKQNIHNLLGIDSEKGIIDCLLNDTPVSDVMIWPHIEKFTLISGGPVTQDSAELLGSQRMHDLVNEMKMRYQDRYVFFDTPPLLSGADALTFMSLVDCVLVVVQADKTPVEDLQHALEMVPQEKLLGLVVNRSKDATDADRRYGYGYGYGEND